jgi:hypothetical protein
MPGSNPVSTRILKTAIKFILSALRNQCNANQWPAIPQQLVSTHIVSAERQLSLYIRDYFPMKHVITTMDCGVNLFRLGQVANTCDKNKCTQNFCQKA